MNSDQPGAKRLLVIGASGGIGLECVREALRRGYHVRAFSRAAQSIAITDTKLETTNGDATRADDVRRAMVGNDVVILALGIPAGPQMVLGPVHLFSDATRVVVDSMRDVGVRRLICITGYGAGDTRSSMGCLQRIVFEGVLGRAYADKDIQERIIRESDLDWVIVRPGILTNAPRTGRYTVLREASTWRNGLIARSDVADFMIDQVASDGYLRATPVLVQ
jgi:putative NADH-flavin reductase